jgi:hypothetical protein
MKACNGLQVTICTLYPFLVNTGREFDELVVTVLLFEYYPFPITERNQTRHCQLG